MPADPKPASELPRLHPDSHWLNDRIVDGLGESIGISYASNQCPCVDFHGETADARAYVDDVLAIIRSQNLDPLAIEAKELCDHLTELEEHDVVGIDKDTARLRDAVLRALGER